MQDRGNCSNSQSTIIPHLDLHLYKKTITTVKLSNSMSHLTGDPKQHDLSSFKDSITGSCLCGSITVTINDNLFQTPRGHLCHCANCRKATGSIAATNLTIEEEKVDIKDRDGTLKLYEDRATNSGNPDHRWFCSVDGKSVIPRS